MKKILLLMSTLLCSLSIHAQYNAPQSRIWAMGNKVGLDFTNPANPVPITTNLQNGNEAAASICDTGGQLLFYTNGTTAWSANGTQMPNGALLAGTGNNTLSTTQGAVIVPVPDSAGKYYLFSLTAVSNCKLYCNKVDMALNGGLGDVVTSFPLRGVRIGIDSFLTEKMTVVPGCNKSVWLIVHVQASKSFRAYHITPAGIDTTPVASNVGNFSTAHYQQGVMKFSPTRTKMMNCNFRTGFPNDAGIEVFEFDYNTGVISNAVTLSSQSFYGGTFSPDGTKVYAGTTTLSTGGNISQWDLAATNPASTKLVLGPSGQYTDLKLGPDGKIYFGALVGSPGYNNYRYMGRVNSPNLAGTACLFQDSVTALGFPNPTNINQGVLAQGLPNDVAVPAASFNQNMRSLDTTVCQLFTQYTLQAPAGFTSRQWDNNDTTASRTVTSRGTYWVRSYAGCDVRVDTFVIGGANMPALAITRAGQTLQATAGFASYQWYLTGQPIVGATSAMYNTTQNGTYSVAANFGSGCKDSVSVVVTDATAIRSIGFEEHTRIYPNPANTVLHIEAPQTSTITIRTLDGRQVMQSVAATQIRVDALPAGTYILSVSGADGRKISREQLVQIIH